MYSRDHGEDRENLIKKTPNGDAAIEMDALPPRWVDTTDEIDELLAKIRQLCAQLDPMHKKHALPGFEDRSQEERDIEALTAQITTLFHRCYNLIKKIEHGSNLSRDVDKIMCRNVTQAIAAKVSKENAKFRKGQSAYLATLKARPSMKSPVVDDIRRSTDSGRSQRQVQAQIQRGRTDTIIEQREREINEIARSITEVADIFKDLNSMVIDQGTTLDRIDYNIETMHVNVKAASKDLVQAENSQSRSRKRKIMLLLILLIVAVIMILIYKPYARSHQAPVSTPDVVPVVDVPHDPTGVA